jgi:lipocalin
MMRPVSLLLFCVLGAVLSCSGIQPAPELPVVSWVDLERYAGTWYEIASYPNRFQKDCVATKATYSLLPDRKVRVLNECRRGSIDAEWDSADGKAWVVDPVTNAKLKVSFFWPFRGDYWVLDLALRANPRDRPAPRIRPQPPAQDPTDVTDFARTLARETSLSLGELRERAGVRVA